MTSSSERLRNLAEKVGSLHAEPTSAEELDRLFSSAEIRLRDACIGASREGPAAQVGRATLPGS